MDGRKDIPTSQSKWDLEKGTERHSDQVLVPSWGPCGGTNQVELDLELSFATTPHPASGFLDTTPAKHSSSSLESGRCRGAAHRKLFLTPWELALNAVLRKKQLCFLSPYTAQRTCTGTQEEVRVERG